MLQPILDFPVLKNTLVYALSVANECVEGGLKNLTENQDLSSLKIYLSGGDYLSVSQSHAGIEYFKQHGAKNITISVLILNRLWFWAEVI